MKALFIWREESVSFIKEVINKQFSEGVKFITSESAFNKFVPDYHKTSDNPKINKELKLERTKRQNDLDSYSKIYILAELGWEKGFVFNGYRIAFEIMRKWQGNKSPCIQIFSIVNRKLIRNQIDDKYKYLVTSMPFVDLGKLNLTHKFSTENMNPYVWESIKYMALSEVGILDNFSHRLDTIDFKKANSKFLLDQLIDEIKSYETFIGEDVLKILNTVIYKLDYTNKLKGMIESRMSEIGGKKKKTIDIPEALNILVVDDNIEELETFKNSLKRYKNHVEYITSGKEALDLIKEGSFHLIISDLELLDKDGFYQEVQGVEIYDAVLKSESSVIGIVTGLGRKGIVKLLKIEESLILPKKNLRKFDVDEEIDDLLTNLLSEFEIKEKSLNLEYGPKKGIINKKGFKTSLSKAFTSKEFYTKTWRDANLIAQKFIDKSLKPNEWNKEIKKSVTQVNFDEFISTKFNSLLGQRLIMIFLAVKNNGWILFEEEEYSEILDSNEINITKNWINTLCIHYNKESEKGFELSITNFFPEELIFYSNLEDKFKFEKSKLLIREHSPSTIVWINKLFDYDEIWYSQFDVSDDKSEWEYSDFNTILTSIIIDLKNKSSNSIYFNILDNILDCPASVLMEINPILPDFKKQLENLGKLSIDWIE